jgi:hypothetical protein
MADVSVNGWIAEGGHTIVEGKKNNLILFDIVESLTPLDGIDDDIYKTNSAWFHCSFEINIEDSSKASFIPTGYTLDRIQSNGWAWIKQEGTDHGWSKNDVFLWGEQIADYIQVMLISDKRRFFADLRKVEIVRNGKRMRWDEETESFVEIERGRKE